MVYLTVLVDLSGTEWHIILNGEEVRIWKETVVEFFKELSLYFSGETGKNHANPYAG
jgi:hypothetical protein